MGGYKTLILFQSQNFPGMSWQLLTPLPGAQAPALEAPFLPKRTFPPTVSCFMLQ